MPPLIKTKFLISILLAYGNLLQADFLTINDGSRLAGTITLIDRGVVHLDTSYAGMLEIDQKAVLSFQTDTPIAIRLKNGTILSGLVRSIGDDEVRIESIDNSVEVRTSKIAASWSPISEDPEIARQQAEQEARQPKWQYRSSIDLTGKTGNTETLHFGGKFEARLKSPDDELTFFAEYEQGDENGNKTTDRLAGGTSYEAFFGEIFGWYIRTELEADHIDNIDLRSTSGAGFSYRLVNKKKQTVIFRSGLGYRYTSYGNDDSNESSPTIDFGLKHLYTFTNNINLENSFSYVPSSEDFGLYTIVHDSGIEIPVNNGSDWNIRIGMKNEYESEPATSKQLDTSYYTKVILSWD